MTFIKLALAGIAYGLLDAFLLEHIFVAKRHFKLNKTATPFCKIVQISDLHLQKVGYVLTNLASYINAQKPDIICFTGDSIDKKENLSLLGDFLKLLDNQIPKFAILGNWEYWSKVDLEALKNLYHQYHTQLLINETVQLIVQNKTISIIGTDDWLAGDANIELALAQHQNSDFNLVLNHCPAYTDELIQKSKISIDLILSGHTHGGQLNLFGYAPFCPKGSGRFVGGWYESENKPPLYVSRGIGTSIYPIRFWSRSEISIIEV